jgi:predicted MFS family arabinose efflux permease
MPTRQSFVIELVGKEDLMNAIALNSSIFNVARIAGPAIAGIIMVYYGVAYCFLFNSISFAAVIVSLIFLIKPNEENDKTRETNSDIIKDIIDGLKFIYDKKILYKSILIMAIIGTFAMNFNVLIPIYAKEVLHQQETGFGLLLSLMGIGSFFGAMSVAVKSKSGPEERVLQNLPILIGIILIMTATTNSFLLTALFLMLGGFVSVAFSSTVNSIMQLNSDSKYRGRVMSIYSLVFIGTTPLGNLYSGAITEAWGPKIGFISCGAIIIVLLIIYKIYLNYLDKNKYDIYETL